jgi:hypothetical protein
LSSIHSVGSPMLAIFLLAFQGLVNMKRRGLLGAGLVVPLHCLYLV